MEEIKEAFDLFDTSGSGEVDKQELIVGLRSLGCGTIKFQFLINKFHLKRFESHNFRNSCAQIQFCSK